jgi:membrane-bound lytic murein transglycosylase B
MNRVGSLLLRGVLSVVGGSLVATASAQVDPLAPLPEPVVQRPVPAPVQIPPRPMVQTYQPSFVIPTAATGFEAYKARLAALARSGGVREATIASVVPNLRVNSRVISLDRGQPGAVGNTSYTPPFEPYRRRHVSADLIRRGQSRYASLWPWLSRVEQRTGVPASVMMAIYGHETSYGAVTGGFDILEALASLAYEGRRRPLFEREFVSGLKLLDMGIPRWRLKGSYAGATGYPQFMPSTVIRLRADGDGDGRSEIWSSEVDGLASIGNYLKDAGWRAGVPWGIAVRVPATLDRNAVRNSVTASECPRVHARHSRPMTMAQWRALGVLPLRRSLPDGETAMLIEPDGRGATAYLLTDNYKAILKYNCSNFYALSVGLLANAIVRL